MKPAIPILCTILIAPSAFAEPDKSVRLSDITSEAGYRNAIARVWPDLEFGFYHFSGQWLIGALEDFNNNRIMLFHPARSSGHLKLIRNGKPVADPIGTIASFPLRGHNERGENATDEYPIGLWVELEATDRFEIHFRTESPAKAEFKATYDPDNGWQTSSSSGVSDQDRKEPADAYEIMRGSLLQRVIDVIGEKEECVVRMNSREFRGMDMVIKKPLRRIPKNITPFEVFLTDRMILGSGGDQQVIHDAFFLQQSLRLYLDAARVAQTVPVVVFRISGKTQDDVFRAALGASCVPELQLIHLVSDD